MSFARDELICPAEHEMDQSREMLGGRTLGGRAASRKGTTAPWAPTRGRMLCTHFM